MNPSNLSASTAAVLSLDTTSHFEHTLSLHETRALMRASETIGASTVASFAAISNGHSQAEVNPDALATVAPASRERAPRCYYPLKPSNGAAPDPGAGFYKGSELKGTRAYERLVNALMNPRNKTAIDAALNLQETEANVNEMRFKQGTILVAACHDGHTAADRVVVEQKPLP